MSRSLKNPATTRRTRHFVDFKVQGALSVSLVLLELALFIIAMGYLYVQFSQLLENNLYTIHQSAQQDLLIVMLKAIGFIVLVMSFVNLAALGFAHAVWQRYVGAVLHVFRCRLIEFKQGNFDRKIQGNDTSHGLLGNMEQWRQRERTLQTAINAHVLKLHALGDQPTSALRTAAIVNELGHLQRLLQEHIGVGAAHRQ